jgi:hypothetical protein
MSDWYEVSLAPNGREGRSRHPSEGAALTYARSLERQHHVIVRIEGPNGRVIDKREIEGD